MPDALVTTVLPQQQLANPARAPIRLLALAADNEPPISDRPHGPKYRLYCGRSGKCLVRYDNERGKGDHRHIEGREEPYRFVSVARLRHDFEADIQRYGGEDEEED
ncbi:MAG TPA: DUF6516 family protein [Casimicrobiaceae bacterium]